MDEKETKIDIYDNAVKIIKISNTIDKLVDELEQAAIDKAQAKVDYARKMALTGLELKNKVITRHQGQPIVSATEKERSMIAESINCKEVYNKDYTESHYKAITVKIDARKAQMNGYQSINKSFN